MLRKIDWAKTLEALGVGLDSEVGDNSEARLHSYFVELLDEYSAYNIVGHLAYALHTSAAIFSGDLESRLESHAKGLNEDIDVRMSTDEVVLKHRQAHILWAVSDLLETMQKESDKETYGEDTPQDK